jgi:hypothetical protein
MGGHCCVCAGRSDDGWTMMTAAGPTDETSADVRRPGWNHRVYISQRLHSN